MLQETIDAAPGGREGGERVEEKTTELLEKANENLRQANRYLLLAVLFAGAWAVILIGTALSVR